MAREVFLSSGEVLTTIDASLKPLAKVISEYVGKGFTGRITFRNLSTGIYISIEVLRGGLVACRGIEKGSVIEGATCISALGKYLQTPDGSVEVVSLSESMIYLDILVFPYSAISQQETPKWFSDMLKAEIPLALPTPPTPQALQQVGPQAQIPTSIPVPIQTPQQPKAEQKLVEYTVTESCEDPYKLYAIIKVANIATQLSSASYDEVFEKIMSITSTANPRYVYVSATLPGGSARILLDTSKKTLYFEVEDSKGELFCGSSAKNMVLKGMLSNIRIWIAK